MDDVVAVIDFTFSLEKEKEKKRRKKSSLSVLRKTGKSNTNKCSNQTLMQVSHK